MFRGFYNLTSEVICQNKNLNVISNNMVNVSTPGYKKDTFVTSTFREELLYRLGNDESIGETSMGKRGDQTVTGFTQGSIENTGGSLDVGLTESGFFKILTPVGPVYTRNGSFGIDPEGYLAINGIGRVAGLNGPLQMPTDNVEIDTKGYIYNASTGEYIGKIETVDFVNYALLQKEDNGCFSTNQAEMYSQTSLEWKSLERSNVDAVSEMTRMMGSQKSIQSSAQVMKMYDQLMGKIVSEIGRV